MLHNEILKLGKRDLLEVPRSLFPQLPGDDKSMDYRPLHHRSGRVCDEKNCMFFIITVMIDIVYHSSLFLITYEGKHYLCKRLFEPSDRSKAHCLDFERVFVEEGDIPSLWAMADEFFAITLDGEGGVVFEQEDFKLLRDFVEIGRMARFTLYTNSKSDEVVFVVETGGLNEDGTPTEEDSTIEVFQGLPRPLIE